ncbi:PQQ-binding-like beta-propeller repeat protein [Umezawaea endophytica]|uniref:PQQ-binding-like beta-propeller repeat protein n=1 Tax=Umezawaea endophytica TaxID=1654476 RepID=A0A9X3AJU1_9PSEU|nr:PQQ-binding-like beta-propeller repeat protein [Umezawaea endophytica]MCS7481995.1 PQQ-binding-like beta-propeller repeat protein [Umezawaea endophytica]
MTTPLRRAALGAAAITTAAVLAASSLSPASAGAGRGHHGGEVSTHVDLPDGFPPESIAIDGGTAYLGSRANGDIYALDLATGEGRVISRGPGTQSLGLAIDSRTHWLYVAGGVSGDARVVDLRTGAVVASYQLVPKGTPAFVNDVLLTERGAVFTDSVHDTLHRVRDGQVEHVPLRGEWVETTEYNANGITTTPDGRALLVVNSTTGDLYRVEENGQATKVDLGGRSFTHPDGLLREGRTLYAVQNAINAIAAVHLDRTGTSGAVVNTLTSGDFDVPTAVARHGDRLYVPNARFAVEEAPGTEYWLTALEVGRS